MQADGPPRETDPYDLQKAPWGEVWVDHGPSDYTVGFANPSDDVAEDIDDDAAFFDAYIRRNFG